MLRIKQMLGNLMSLPPNISNHEELELEDFTEPDTNYEDELPAGWIDGDPIDANGDSVFEDPVMDTLINAEVLLPYEDKMKLVTIKRRTTNING